MADDLRRHLVRNPELDVGRDNLAAWNRAERRREGFRGLHLLHRHGLVLRSSRVLVLRRRIDRRLGDMAALRRLTEGAAFCAMAVVRGCDLLFEAYAHDMDPDMPHALQSITKTNLNLVFGRLVASGSVDLESRVETYVPEVSSGYRGATVQQLLDMAVANNFDENYEAPWNPPPAPCERLGYGQEEIAMNWRLPPPGHAPYGVRELACRLVADGMANPENATLYKSVNSDLAGWIAERASGHDLKAFLVDHVEAAGIEAAFHISLDKDFVPVLSGGGAMTARDLARFGLVFARRGIGVDGKAVGDPAFIEATRSGRGTWLHGPREDWRYSNHSFTNGRWIGHGGYGGQFLMADPDKEAAIAFFSVLESHQGEDDSYLPEVAAMCQEVLERL